MRARHELHKLRAGGRLYCFGGGSSSASSSTSNTENIDQRLLQESGAIGANASGGGSSSVSLSSTTNNTDSRSFSDSSKNTSVNITNTLDGGAIKDAFGLGNHAIDSVTDFATSALSGAHHTAELALNGALSSVQDTKDAFYDAAKIAQSSALGAQQSATAAYANATDQVATAYEGARVGNKNILIVSGMALAAMALAVYGSRKS